MTKDPTDSRPASADRRPVDPPPIVELPLLAWHTLIALRPLVTLFSRTCLFVMKGNTA